MHPTFLPACDLTSCRCWIRAHNKHVPKSTLKETALLAETGAFLETPRWHAGGQASNWQVRRIECRAMAVSRDLSRARLLESV